MTVRLTTHKDLQEGQNLSFCYLCGQDLGFPNEIDRDHVPPSGLFALADRDPPLILPTHRQCNQKRSREDQAIGQLVGVLHGRRVNPAHNKLHVAISQFKNGNPAAVLRDIDIKEIIRRWVRGFHAALYREYIPQDALFATYPPLPEGKHVGDQITFVPIPEAFIKFVEEIRRNRAVGSLDRIACRNEKCRYECVWSQADDGKWICVYCLDLYNWIELGDLHNFTGRGCVGCYRRPLGGVPPNAATTTRLLFDCKPVGPFDPFAE
jgi:hypothetical protein